MHTTIKYLGNSIVFGTDIPGPGQVLLGRLSQGVCGPFRGDVPMRVHTLPGRMSGGGVGHCRSGSWGAGVGIIRLDLIEVDLPGR